MSPDQQMLQDMVRKFATFELEPVAAEIDKTQQFPTEIIKKLAKLGLMGITIPTEYGGAGFDTVSYAIAVEELSRVSASTGLVVLVNNSLATYPIYLYGDETQKQKYLTPLAKGEKIGSFALSEIKSGSDISDMETSVVIDGDSYIINGKKCFVTNGVAAEIFIVFASTDKTKGKDGVGCFIVERETEGFSVGRKEDIIGMRGAGTCELDFKDCKADIIGKEGDGAKVAGDVMDICRIGIAAQAVGIGQGALEDSIKYSKERQQFGRPICKFQMVQELLAETATRISAARLLLYDAALKRDLKKPYVKEAAMAKLYASETAMLAGKNAVQIYGGYGYTKDYPVERYMRDAKVTEIYEQPSEIQKLIIAQKLLE